MNRVRSGSISAFSVARPGAPGSTPMMSRMLSRCASKRPTSPHSMASASPRCTISAAITVLERRTVALAASTDTPLRAIRRW